MANAKGKSVDTTSLHLVAHTAIYGEIHRDYLAHCLRYNHVVKFLGTTKGKKLHVLDVGCGPEAPLARTLRSMMAMPASYTGVDINTIPWPWPKTTPKKARCNFIERSNFLDVELSRATYDVITCFEVLEHVEPLHAFRILKRIRSFAKKSSYVFVSTPVFDPKVGAAKNHVNEMSYDAMMALIILAGFDVDNVWGTFASQKDYKKLLDKGELRIFEALAEYYQSSVLSCLFAPLFPKQSRNCLWQLRYDANPEVEEVASWLADPEHGSSKLWSKQFKQITKEVCNGI